MGLMPEPDGVDFVVEGGDTDPESIRETIEFIKQYKQRPGYAEELREAKRILESLKANSKNYVELDPDALLEQWKRTAEELKRRGIGVNGSSESAVGLDANEDR
jgi:hypothetical protein